MMNHSPKAVTFPIVLALALAGGNAAAERISAEQIYAELPAEIAQDGQRFMNTEKATELRHRVRTGEENAEGKAVRERKELQAQQEGKGKQKKEQHKHQYKEKTGGPHKNQSGSFGAFSGKGPSGGNGGGGGGRR